MKRDPRKQYPRHEAMGMAIMLIAGLIAAIAAGWLVSQPVSTTAVFAAAGGILCIGAVAAYGVMWGHTL